MKKVGFFGGSSIFELGSSADVCLFFDCLNAYVAKQFPREDWSLLTDRLYRRYLKMEELDRAHMLMEKVKRIFMTLPSSSIDWSYLKNDIYGYSLLNPNKKNLYDIFSKYFEAFDYCVESTKLFFKSWNIFQPVRVVVSDLPEFFLEKKRSLESYEALKDRPFWLQ